MPAPPALFPALLAATLALLPQDAPSPTPPTPPAAPSTPAPPAPAPAPAPITLPAELSSMLLLERPGATSRSPIRTDALEAALVRGAFTPPQEGASITLPDGSVKTWKRVNAGEGGFLRDEALRGGYAFAAVESARDQVVLLEATGHNLVLVNGQPRVGDPYQYGTTVIPIQLRSGSNQLLFSVGRGVLKARLLPLPNEGRPTLERRDTTAPDLVAGQPVDALMGVIVVNPGAESLRGAVVAAQIPGGPVEISPVWTVPPQGFLKVPVRVKGPAPAQPGTIPVTLRLLAAAPPAPVPAAPNSSTPAPAGSPPAAPAPPPPFSELSVDLRVVDPGAMRRETFLSEIDGSVQYFAVQPCTNRDPAFQPGLILSLHGASVEGANQAAAYAPKSWAHVVAPTNRRPFGFDWEDWGRLDALEVLGVARDRLRTNPLRQWVTGHSMGGHGTWQLASLFPDRFAAAAPSAGWISFASYGSGNGIDAATPIGAILARASLPSDTLKFRDNLTRMGVYVLHGDADDNVPVSQARAMRAELGQFHPDFAYHEQPGQGHWWGNECVDWPHLLRFLEERSLVPPAQRGTVRFITPSPTVSARCDWVVVDAPERWFEPTRVDLTRDANAGSVKGTTVNALRMELDLAGAGLPADKPVDLELDGRQLKAVAWPGGGRLWLEKGAEGWKISTPPSVAQKDHERGGPFKDAFRRRMVFVYGTSGTPEENAWSLAKARYDAEAFWYRGNGAVEVVADAGFDPRAWPDRNVIIYGNAETNAAWNQLLRESPVQVRRDGVAIGGRKVAGDSLACLFLRPRPDSGTACVAAVAGTGLPGMKLTDRIPYWVSGVSLPDVTVIGTDMLERGQAGFRAAGFFGNDWSVERGDFAFRD